MRSITNPAGSSPLFIVTFVCILFAISCSKKEVLPPASGNELTGITISKTDNPGLAEDAYVYRSGNKFYITVHPQYNLANVTVRFSTSANATVKVNGTAATNNTGKFDLSKTIEVNVTAQNGSSSVPYTILAQLGIKDIDALIYPFIEKYKIPAATYAIAKNSIEDIVYKNASGFADTLKKERATPGHIFRLASMTKQHTAIAIMTLIQKGSIGIDDLVFGPTGILKAYWPSVGPMSSQVTVRHLLEHTAGYTGDPMFSTAYDGQTLDQRIGVMLNSAQAKPGTQYTYYNMGYGTLGKIIEVVSGKDYETYLKEIYAPAGVTDLHLAASAAAQRRSNEAVNYGQDGNNAYRNSMEVYKAAGGVTVNTTDLFKILYAVDGGTIRPDILNAPTRTLMFTPSTVFQGYAKGWRTNHSLFGGYYHGGNLAGTGTFWIYGGEYSAAILLNSRSYDDAFDTDLILLTNNIINKAKALGL